MLSIEFVPETPEEKYEAAKLEVIALLDDPAWRWLRARINDDGLDWPSIFDLVAANS